jgi:hypothetical protein
VTSRWDAHLLRISLIGGALPEVTSETWAAMTGSPPDLHETRAREGITRISGRFEGAQLTFAALPGRRDLVIQPAPPAPDSAPSPIAGDALDLIGKLYQLAPAVLHKTATTSRIAFAGTLLRSASSLEAAYEDLASLVKSVRVEPKKMRDLLYQVNWRKELNANVEANRLTKWSAITFTLLAGTSGPGITVSETNYVQLEFDINTVPSETRSFSGDEGINLLARLIELAQENLANGEVVTQ